MTPDQNAEGQAPTEQHEATQSPAPEAEAPAESSGDGAAEAPAEQPKEESDTAAS